MPTPYKLKILNGVLKLKTFSDHVLSILGIKDLGTQTGHVTNGYVDWSIQHLTQTTAQWNADTTTILLVGQIGVENTGTNTYKFKIGNGVDLWSALGYAGGGDAVDVNTIGTAINGAASATPNDTDLVMSVDTSVAKKNTWTQIKAFLKTYFDTIYQASGSYLTSANITQTITNGVTDKAPSEDAVFDALALKQNIVAGVDDTEIGYLNGVTSAIQTQLNEIRSGRKYFAYDNTTYSYTGTTSDTILRTIYIPANTMGINSVLEVYMTAGKSGTAGAGNLQAYITTNALALTGGTYLGYSSMTAAQGQVGRGIRITNKNSLSSKNIASVSAPTFTFFTPNNGVRSSVSINFAVDQYLHIFSNLISSSDTFILYDYQAYIDNP